MATQIPILFFNEKITFTLRDKIAVRTWLASILKTEGHKLNHINYIFCTDKYLHKINLQYLQHNTYTDIITFNNSNLKGTAEADIFISIQRVKENAKTLQMLEFVQQGKILFVDLPTEAKAVQSSRIGRLLLQEVMLISGLRKALPMTGAQYANLIASYLQTSFGHRGITLYREVPLGIVIVEEIGARIPDARNTAAGPNDMHDRQCA